MTDLLTRIERGEPVEAQEVFDFAVGKVIEQGAPALSADNFCAYRGDLGRKCAFGHLIPDSLYESRFEGSSAYAILCHNVGSRYSSRLAASLEQHSDLVVELQQTHDNLSTENLCSFVDNFRQRAETVAKDHGLTFKF